MSLTYKEVADILKIIEASSLAEVVLELGATRLVVRRGAGSQSAAPAILPVGAAARQVEATPAAGHAVSAPAAPAAAARAGVTEIRAPMVGTFYRRPSPNDPAFVEVGQTVKAGDSLCLIEVMKLYNTITSPVDGVVDAILPADASLVAFDQLLIAIRPT